MKQELKQHVIPLLAYGILTSIYWIFSHHPPQNILLLFLGLMLGAHFLDIDHLIYWLITHKNLPESQIATSALKAGDYKKALQILDENHKSHLSLTFHHFYFHLLLIPISIFVLTSTNSIFGKSFVLAINWHLFIDIYTDWINQPLHLQSWLFARMSQQLPLKFLSKYWKINVFLVGFYAFSLFLS